MKKYTIQLAVLLVLFFCNHKGLTQDVMLQGWYWDYPKFNCNGYSGSSLAVELSGKAAELKGAGFTMVWLPPMTKASFGNCSNGYDPRDLYDYGQYTGRTGLGTGSEVLSLIAALNGNDLLPVADVVYNHRDGGEYEDNPAVRDYILNYPNGGGCTGGSATPYPVNGKMRYVLPLGGSSGNGAGDYYFKFSTASGNPGFNGRQYKLYFRTSSTTHNPTPIYEVEPNGGGDCSEPNNTILLGHDVFATQEVGGGCNTDEFHLNLTNSDFNLSGDHLEIYIEEVGGGGMGIDQRIYGIWGPGGDTHPALKVQTRTDFSGLPSGKGGMNYLNFKPNGITPTCMTGDEEFPYFFFDVEQAHTSTRNVYSNWNSWLWDTLGIRGYRMDAVKHFPGYFVGQLLDDLHNEGKNPPLVVGEHFTSDAFALKGWIDDVLSNMSGSAQSAIHVRAFDFELRDALRHACESPGYDVRNIFNSGLVDRAGAGGYNSVTFVNNHDYRHQDVYHENDPLLGYAYILTNNKVGLPSVFYADYYGATLRMDDNSTLVVPSYKDEIDQLIGIHQQYITGSTQVDYLSRYSTPYPSNFIGGYPSTTLIYQLKYGAAGKDVVVAINFAGEELEVNQQINTAGLSSNEKFYDATGNALYATPEVEYAGGVDNSLYIKIPARSYAVFVNDPAALDIDWLSIRLEEQKKSNTVIWEVRSSEDVERFEIQRSSNGQLFETIGVVLPEEQLNETLFSYEDKAILGERFYYRVKGVEWNGQVSFSRIAATRASGLVHKIEVVPNPISNDMLKIVSDRDILESIRILRLYDISGRPVWESKSAVNQIDVSSFPAGQYILQIVLENDVVNKKVYIQK